MFELQEIPIHCPEVRKKTGLERAWVVIVNEKVFGDGNKALHLNEEDARAAAKEAS